jgi:hypothetical protein
LVVGSEPPRDPPHQTRGMTARTAKGPLLGVVLSLASVACAGVGSRPVAGPTPSVSPSPEGGKEKLCQPFPVP